MRLYCTFLACNPGYEQALLENPFIEQQYHDCYYQLGPGELSRLGYDEAGIKRELPRQKIARQCRLMFQSGHAYTAAEVKTGLQKIFDSLGISTITKANQIANYISAIPVQRTLPDGSRPRMYLIK